MWGEQGERVMEVAMSDDRSFIVCGLGGRRCCGYWLTKFSSGKSRKCVAFLLLVISLYPRVLVHNEESKGGGQKSWPTKP